MRWFAAYRVVVCAALTVGLAASAQAGSAMFEASFFMDTFGNDITTGTTWPSAGSYFARMPIGGAATGSGSISVTPTGPVVAPIALPQSAFGVATAAYWPLSWARRAGT